MDFPCNSCGACCRIIGRIIHDYPFPFKTNEDGACEKFIEGKCSVYETRPDICNVEKMAAKLNIDKKTFFNQNIAVCNLLMDAQNVPREMRLAQIV